MYTSQKYLDKRTPANQIGRQEYIKLLADEYKISSSLEAKLQVTANLANFAYDPINFQFLREADVLSIFLELLESANESLKLHGICGICNICVESESREYLLAANGFAKIVNLLETSKNSEIILNSLTTLIHLLNLDSESFKLDSKVIEIIRNFENSENSRIKNLATLLLENYRHSECTC